jgi:hypothetical protein
VRSKWWHASAESEEAVDERIAEMLYQVSPHL